MADSIRCRFCRDLSIETLVSLAKKEIDGYHSFPQQAFYQHQPSINDLEASASNGCDLCDLILGCLFVTSPETLLGTGSPEQREDQDCDLDESMYAVAKTLETSCIKIAITADHLYCNEVKLPADCQLDTLLVQVGPRADDPDEYGMHWELPPLFLTLSLPVGAFHNLFYLKGLNHPAEVQQEKMKFSMLMAAGLAVQSWFQTSLRLRISTLLVAGYKGADKST